MSKTHSQARPAVPWYLALLVGLVSAILVAGAFFGGAAVTGAVSSANAAPAEEYAAKSFGPVRAAPSLPSAAEPFRACSVNDVTSQPGALEFHGYVIETATGTVLFDRRADQTNPTASNMKLLTSAAALSVLGPDYRIPTRVYAGDNPGEIFVVGYGDVTLSSLAPGIPSYYSGATGFMAELAAQVREAWAANPDRASTPITSIKLDASLFDGDWHKSWDVIDRVDGYISEITALQVDGDRAIPQNIYSTRSEEPVLNAGHSFAVNLGVDPNIVQESGRVPEGAELLGEVYSQPVSELIGYVLTDSDNSVAEALARLVAIELGVGNSFDSINGAMHIAMTNLGLDPDGLLIADGSGLSPDNRVSAKFMVDLLQLVKDDAFGLGVMEPLLPKSYLTGTLKDRLEPSSSGVPQGSIQAKTGFINDVYALSGFMDVNDGTQLTFSLFMVGNVDLGHRAVLDQIAASVYTCGGQLANW